jgi:hypothetical protein
MGVGMLTRDEMKELVVRISVSEDGIQTTPRISDLEERLGGLLEHHKKGQSKAHTRTMYPWRFVYTLGGVRLRFPQFAPFGEPVKKTIKEAIAEFVLRQSARNFLEVHGFSKEDFEAYKPPC